MKIELSALSDKELGELIPLILKEQENRENDCKIEKWKAVCDALDEYLRECGPIEVESCIETIDSVNNYSKNQPGEFFDYC